MAIITEIIISYFDVVLGPSLILSYPLQINQKLLDHTIMASVYNFQLDNPPITRPIYLAVTDFKRKCAIYIKRMPQPEQRNRPIEFMLCLLVQEQDDVILYKYEADISIIVVEFLNSFFKHSLFLQSDYMKDLPQYADQLSKEIKNLQERINNQLDAFLRMENLAVSNAQEFPAEQKIANKRDYTFKIAVLGDPSVGKTSSIMRYTDRAFRRSYIPTVGVNITEKKIETLDSSMSIMIWDLAGHIKFQTIRKHYYSGATGILLLFDLTNLESFLSISEWYRDINRQFEQTPIPIILVGNKSDLLSERKVSSELIQNLVKETALQYIETSAKTGQNIDSAFDLLIATIVKHL